MDPTTEGREALRMRLSEELGREIGLLLYVRGQVIKAKFRDFVEAETFRHRVRNNSTYPVPIHDQFGHEWEIRPSSVDAMRDLASHPQT
jgi:hypothetical protein